MTKLLVIGWDGASRDNLEQIETPFYDSLEYSGRLLPEKVFRGIPIDSGTAWTTITTGLEVEEHGILTINNIVRSKKFLSVTKKIAENIGWRKLRTYAFYGPNKLFNLKNRTPRSTDVQYKRLWDYIEGKTLTLGVPHTYPAWKHNGRMLSGIPAPLDGDMPDSYPVDYSEYRKRYNGYYFLQDKSWPLEKESQPNLEEYKESIYECCEDAFDVLKELDREDEFELIFAIVPILDDLLHALDPEEDWDQIEKAYQWIDQRTEDLVEKIDPDHVLIISDHGMKPVEESLNISHGDGMKMDHDSMNGVWASNTDLELEEQKDVTPAVLKLFGIEFGPDKLEMEIPSIEEENETGFTESDEEEVKQKLKNLGYMSD